MLWPPDATKAATIPASTSALPANEYSASFIAAYSRCDPAFSPVASWGTDPQIAIRKYFGIIAIS